MLGRWAWVVDGTRQSLTFGLHSQTKEIISTWEAPRDKTRAEYKIRLVPVQRGPAQQRSMDASSAEIGIGVYTNTTSLKPNIIGSEGKLPKSSRHHLLTGAMGSA